MSMLSGKPEYTFPSGSVNVVPQSSFIAENSSAVMVCVPYPMRESVHDSVLVSAETTPVAQERKKSTITRRMNGEPRCFCIFADFIVFSQ